MKYIVVRWKHDLSYEPNLLYSELDDARWERRKVEMYADGQVGYADSQASTGSTQLGLAPIPELAEINSKPEFEAEEIAQDEFERVWVKVVEKSGVRN